MSMIIIWVFLLIQNCLDQMPNYIVEKKCMRDSIIIN